MKTCCEYKVSIVMLDVICFLLQALELCLTLMSIRSAMSLALCRVRRSIVLKSEVATIF